MSCNNNNNVSGKLPLYFSCSQNTACKETVIKFGSLANTLCLKIINAPTVKGGTTVSALA